MTGVSWFEAVEFSRRDTEWLLGHAPEALPKEDREPGFLRLPTEEEWEFAARGGLAVDAADFLAPRFPMPEGDLARYAWYESSGSAEGELHPVGLLKPNPLGFYDILGNASELTLTPFHLDRRGRDHGQAGGFVSRGGDLLTPESQLGSAVRQEHNYFDPATGRAKTMDSLGFRLVVTAPVIVSAGRLSAIKQSWTDLPQLTGDAGTDAALALRQLQELSIQTQDEALRDPPGDHPAQHGAVSVRGERGAGAHPARTAAHRGLHGKAGGHGCPSRRGDPRPAEAGRKSVRGIARTCQGCRRREMTCWPRHGSR